MTVILTTPDELRAIVRAAVDEALAARPASTTPAEWLDAQEAAALAGVHKKTLRRLQAPSHRVGRLVRYRRAELEGWIAGRSTPVPAAGPPKLAHGEDPGADSRVVPGPWRRATPGR